MTQSHPLGLVLAVQPSARGFGWVLFEGDMVPVDWGVCRPKRAFSTGCMKKFEKILLHYQPTALVLEAFDTDSSQRGDTVRTLAKTMKGFAENHDLEIAVYDREEVSFVVANDEDATRHEVALAASERLPILRHELLPERKTWEPEHDRRCLFDAAALGIAHYILTHRS